jgi:hypothetical protein
MAHAGGRPTDIQEIKDFHIWESEKSLNDSLFENINDFMQNIFNEKVKSATNKKSERKGTAKLQSGQVLPLRGVRLDMWVECESGNNYIIEIKNPKYSNYDTFKAIGQILGYSIKFPNSKLVILSTVYDEGYLEVIKQYNLPIDFVLLTENSYGLLIKNG